MRGVSVSAWSVAVATCAALGATLAAPPRSSLAQEAPPSSARPDSGAASSFHASPYLQMGSWEYPILDYWIAAGRLDDLSPDVQPYRRMEVARAIRTLRGKDLHPFERRWLEKLEREFAPELAVLGGKKEDGYASVGFSGGAADWTQTSRDPLRPRLHGPFAVNRVLEHVSVDAEARGGPLAGAVHAVRDGIYRHDAQYPGGRVVSRSNFPILPEEGIRFDEAYAELQWKYARVFAGRMNRNWGPPHTPGFLLSDYAYSWDQIGYRFGSDRIFLIGTLSSFNDFPGDTARYLAVHRLEWRARDNFMLAFSEAVIQGGPGARLNWRILNPVALWETTTKETGSNKQTRNDLAQADVWWRPVDGLVLSGSLIADNSTALNKTDQSCCGIGGTVEVQLPHIAPGVGLRLQGTAVQSLVYRTSYLPWERYTVDGIGLGWDKTDVRVATIEASWLGVGGLVLKPRIDFQQKGEGDMHDPLTPPADSLPAYPRILVGQTETTIRPALAGVWHRGLGRGWSVDMDWDVGVDFIRDFQHVKGRNATALVGVIRVVIRTPRLLLGLD
ncbi:MAG: hypothetical protein Q8W51_05685 [Candidatus Palauibacterales bacterium]|nr:hypothetical protein [Candidatus Palauibacterales bacterium]